MNNEQKQIEEMAKDLDDCVSYDEWSAREYGEYTVDCDYTAYKLFSKGQRKLTENAVILTEKELLDNLNYHYYKGYKKGCKETAREFYLSFIDELMRGCGDDKEFWVVKLINEKVKQFGVEVE